MNLKKKVNKEEANHKQQIKLKIKMMKRKNLFQEANPNLKNRNNKKQYLNPHLSFNLKFNARMRVLGFFIAPK